MQKSKELGLDNNVDFYNCETSVEHNYLKEKTNTMRDDYKYDKTEIIFPSFRRPETREDAFRIAEQLTGGYWKDFLSPRSVSRATWDCLGGQAFHAKRVKGPEGLVGLVT